MSSDPYSDEAARLRALVQAQLREGTEPTLLPYEQLVLCGWYERTIHRLEGDLTAASVTVDANYADRLEAERASMAAVNALVWDERTATPLDDREG